MRIAAIARPEQESGEQWDRFAEAHPRGTLGHAFGWARVLREAYGLESHYLEARQDGRLVGVLPLVRFRALRGGLEVVSQPFLDSGGILADTPEAERALLDAALERVRAWGARRLELRQLLPLETAAAPAELNRVDLVLPLEPDAERQWKALGAKVRNQTRKAEKEGLCLEAGESAALVPRFYAPFAENMRQLGSPVHGRAFFEAAARAFGERLRVVVTRRGSQPVGGLVAIHFGEVVSVPWASTLRSERRACPNNHIYWEAIGWAIRRGASHFDFGRSPQGSGTWRFKKGWGAQERPLAWLRFAPSGETLPGGGVDESPVLERLAAVWARLPLAATVWLGPRIRRHFSN